MTDKLVSIKQIMPADDWYVLYREYGGGYWHQRLACWALVRREDSSGGGYDKIEGMVPVEYGIDDCESMDNFVSYCHESSLANYPECTNDRG